MMYGWWCWDCVFTARDGVFFCLGFDRSTPAIVCFINVVVVLVWPSYSRFVVIISYVRFLVKRIWEGEF